jgi:CheY-like chemotaxis protein
MKKVPTVLIVEDDEIAQIVTKGLLESYGCHCKVADTGSAAINLASEYDLVFMDLDRH